MAIDRAYFHYLAPLLNELGAGRAMKIACLSYPDLLLPPESVAKAFSAVDVSALKVRPDSESICAWHGIKPAIPVTDTTSLLTALGHTVDFFDVKAFRGPEIIVDLNEPLPDEYEGQYDLVVDTGTLEHCFNVGVAFVGMCRLAKPEGVILTAAPMAKINHGFWNFSPCVYENFFSQNGWNLRFLQAFFKANGEVKQFSPSPNGRFVGPSEASLIVCAMKKACSTVAWPTQKKYLTN